MMLDAVAQNQDYTDAVAERDLLLPANCFSAGYAGAYENIDLRVDPGPDLLRPRSPAVYVGHKFLPVDFRGGAVMHYNQNGPMVHRATLNSFVSPKGLTISTLKRPAADRVEETLVLANVAMPQGHLLRPISGQDGKVHNLNIQCGLHHTGKVLLADGDKALLRLEEGQYLCLLFPDGFVRKFVAKVGGQLVEEHLSFRQMVQVRVDDAHKRLDNLGKKPDFVVEDVKHILSGMVDLFHRTPGDKHAPARGVLQEFFFKELSDTYLSLVHRKLTAVLHAVDPVMVHALSASVAVVQAPTASKGTVEAAAKRAATDARKKALRAERDALSQRMKGSSAGGGEKKGGKK
jgi:hypothetical protein